MADQWNQDLDEIGLATARLLATINAFDESDVGRPSVLDGWTRGHVMAHIEANARGLARLARQQIDGLVRPMYISREVRNADVELHANRSASAHHDAVRQSAQELDRDMHAVPSEAITRTAIIGTSTHVPVSRLAPQRLLEVCVHHSDLGVPSYTWRDWPARLAAYFIPVVTQDFTADGAFPVDWIEADGTRFAVIGGKGSGVRGSGSEILAWLIGRAPGDGLEAIGTERVPVAPAWR